MMKERGLTFCQELVPKVLDGSKFITRRLGGLKEINEYPDAWTCGGLNKFDQWIFWGREEDAVRLIKCRQGVVGDRFYMQEAWGLLYPGTHKPYDLGAEAYKAWRAREEMLEGLDIKKGALIPVYKADDCQALFALPRWRSGRFQPKWACRPQRWELVSIRPERVQEITEQDAIAEGVEIIGHRDEDGRAKILMRLSGKYPPCDYLNKAQDNIVLAHFASLWDTINAKRGYPWERNNWVWREEWNPKPVIN